MANTVLDAASERCFDHFNQQKSQNVSQYARKEREASGYKT